MRFLPDQALVVSNSIGRDGLVGAAAAQRRSRAVAFLLQVLLYRTRQTVTVAAPRLRADRTGLDILL